MTNPRSRWHFGRAVEIVRFSDLEGNCVFGRDGVVVLSLQELGKRPTIMIVIIAIASAKTFSQFRDLSIPGSRVISVQYSPWHLVRVVDSSRLVAKLLLWKCSIVKGGA